MPSYSKVSRDRLNTAVQPLQMVFERVLELGYDHSILCGERGKEEQHAAFIAGYSKKDFPASKHNCHPSKAVDAQPYPAREKDKRWVQDCIFFAGIVVATGKSMGINIRWGGDWDSDHTMTDENGLIDMPHFEVI